MKRMFLIAGIALSIISCAQHDTNTPDTSGNDPQDPNRSTMTSDTMAGSQATDSAGNSPNMNNDHSNNNGTVNTADSTRK